MSRVVAALLALAAATATAAPRRFVVVIASDVGDVGEERLHFAEADGRRVADVLQRFGGVAAQDTRLLLGARAPEVREALRQIARELASAPHSGDELLVYVSGHADDGALELAGTHLPLADLAQFTREVPVGVALLVIDSCRSGTVTRLKGLKPMSGVAVQAEVPPVQGRVFITATGPDEYAQESDSIEGSYFTHHWLAGLRGAADRSHDGVVTLEEAYQYAYVHTLESTFGSSGGTQHPSFAVDLSGRGQLALTWPGSAPSRLVLQSSASGEWLLTEEGGAQVGPFQKEPGTAVLAMAPGRYHVQQRRDDELFVADVTVPASGEKVLTDEELHRVRAAWALRKGGIAVWALSVELSGGAAAVPNFGAAWGLDVDLEHRLAALGGIIDGLSLSVGGRASRALGYLHFPDAELDLRFGPTHHERWGSRDIRLRVAVAATGVLEWPISGQAPVGALAPGARIGADFSWPLGGSWLAALSVEGGPSLVRTESGLQVVGVWRAGAGASLRF